MSATISITIFLSVIFGLGSPYVTGWLMVESVAALMQTKFNIFQKELHSIFTQVFF